MGERCLVRYWSPKTKDKNTAICWYGGTFYSSLVQVIGRLSFVRTARPDRPIVKCKASWPVLPFQGRVSLARNSSKFGSIVALHLQNGRYDWSVLTRGKRPYAQFLFFNLLSCGLGIEPVRHWALRELLQDSLKMMLHSTAVPLVPSQFFVWSDRSLAVIKRNKRSLRWSEELLSNPSGIEKLIATVNHHKVQ